jgi:galacturonosyltransferase
LLKNIEPDIVFTYTVKPNVYAGMACASLNIPYVSNITGLGTAIENGGMMQKFLLLLYRYGLRKAQKVFFQNDDNCKFMLSKGVVKGPYEILPGSGVNLSEHKAEAYPELNDFLVFVIIGRIMKSKGADEVLYASKKIRERYPNVIFRMIGDFEDAYQDKVNAAVKSGEIEYLGRQSNIHVCLKDSHAIVHASYHEGMSNVMLETASCGRPVIATDVPGCRETYDDGISGISFKAKDSADTVRAVREFLNLPYLKKVEMGMAGRKKMEKEFDRNFIVKTYMETIDEILK